MKCAIIFIAACAMSTWANAGFHRSKQVLRAFVNQQACPATGLHRLPCKGYVMDHRIGLCVGGSDTPSNMRWMTKEAAKAKDRWECKPGWEHRLSECEAKGCFVM